MKLQRYTSDDPHGGTFDGHPTEYYRAADVDALLARIRAAVEAWMMAPRGEESCDDPDCGCWDQYHEARAALDALLADGDCQTMDTNRTQAIAEEIGRAHV